jgi:hypothetical protein
MPAHGQYWETRSQWLNTKSSDEDAFMITKIHIYLPVARSITRALFPNLEGPYHHTKLLSRLTFTFDIVPHPKLFPFPVRRTYTSSCIHLNVFAKRYTT